MSKHLYLLFLFAYLPVIGIYAQGPPAPTKQKTDYSQDAFVVERSSTETSFENDGTGTRESEGRVRIQSDSGVQHYAVLTFPYQSSTENLEIEYVRVRKPDASLVVTPEENVQDLPSEITRQAPLYSDLREKHVAVKGLGVGDVLEYQAHWHTTKPLAPGQFWFSYNFSTDGIVLQEILRITVPRERSVKLRSPKSKPVVSETDARQVFTWTSSQLEHKSKEQQEKDQQTAAYEAGRGKLPQADVQVSSFQTWEEVGRWYNGLQRERAKATPEIRAKAAELTKGSADDLAKIHAIYNYVSSRIHYIGVDFGIGRYQPHAASEVLANQFGDCKDKHTLLAALLDASGIQASPALIGFAHEVDPDLPSPGQFDHVISAVKLGDHLTWLDSTVEVGPFAYLLSGLRGKQALLIAPDKPPALIATPADPPQKPLHTFRIDAKLGDTGTLQGKIEQTIQGDDREVLLRAAYRSVPAPQWKDLTQQISYTSGFAGEVSDVTVSSPEKTDEALHFSYNYLRKDYPDWSNRRVSSPLPPMALPAAPEKEEKPDNPIWLGSPAETRLESYVELPKGYRPTLPKNLDVTESFAEYHRAYAVKDGIMTTRRQLIVKRSEVPAAEYEAYRNFSKTVAEEWGRTVPLLSGPSSMIFYQNEIWDLSYSENADAARAYDDARDRFNKQDTKGEIASLKHAVEIDPKFTRAWFWLGEIYRASGRLDEAVQAYRKGIAVDPEQTVGYKALGLTLLMMQKTHDALDTWQQLIKVAPSDSAGPEGLGMSLVSLERYQEAESALETAAQLAPESFSVHMTLGKACLHAGHREKAIVAYRKALELTPQPMTFNNVAYELAETNADLPAALEYAKRAVTEEGVASQQVNLSQLRVEDLQHPNSLAMFWDTLGWVYFKMGNPDEAEKYLNAAWTLAQNPVVADHLGQVYERQNKKQAAIRMYRFAMNRAPAKAAGAGGQKDETLARLKRLSPGASKDDFKSMESSFALSSMRMTKLPPLVAGQASAEFFLIFAQDRKTSAVSVEDVKFVSGSESLKSAGGALKSADFKVLLPADGHPRLLRRGVLGCSPRAGCSFVLFGPEDVNSVN